MAKGSASPGYQHDKWWAKRLGSVFRGILAAAVTERRGGGGLRHINVVTCDSMTSWRSYPHRERLDAGSGRNGCVAPAGQRRCPYLDLAVAQRAAPGRQHRIPHPGWFSVHSDTDLPRIAAGVAASRARSLAASKRPSRTRSISQPKDRSAMWCRAIAEGTGGPFTSSYTTRFPEYISARVPIPQAWVYAALRRFHAAANRDDGVDAIAHARAAPARV